MSRVYFYLCTLTISTSRCAFGCAFYKTHLVGAALIFIQQNIHGHFSKMTKYLVQSQLYKKYICQDTSHYWLIISLSIIIKRQQRVSFKNIYNIYMETHLFSEMNNKTIEYYNWILLSRSCWCAQAGHQMSLCVEHMACCLFGAMCSHVDCLSPPILLLNHCFSSSSCVSIVTLVCLPI